MAEDFPYLVEWNSNILFPSYKNLQPSCCICTLRPWGWQNHPGQKGPQEMPSPTYCSKQGQLSGETSLLTVLFSLFSKIPEDGDGTSLGLCSSALPLSEWKLFSLDAISTSCFSLWPLFLHLWLCTLVKSLAPSSWWPPCRYQGCCWFPWSHLFSSPVASDSPHRASASALTIPAALCWICSGLSMSLSQSCTWLSYSPLQKFLGYGITVGLRRLHSPR